MLVRKCLFLKGQKINTLVEASKERFATFRYFAIGIGGTFSVSQFLIT